MRFLNEPKRLYVRFCLPCAVFFAATSAVTASVFEVQGTIQNVPELTTFETWGGPDKSGLLVGTFSPNNMEGIEVTAFFSASAPEPRSWIGTGFPDPGGGVIGKDGDWSLRNLTPVPNHTYANPWELSYSGGAKGNLIGFEIDGFGKLPEVIGSTVFDTDLPFNGTPGSDGGNSFNVIGNTHATTATYSDAVKLAAAAVPEGDLYRRLRVEFNGKVDTKWSQRPVQGLGENIHSDIDWRRVMDGGDRSAAADDFISDGRPITGVRWWGSYFNPDDQPQPDPINQGLVPQVEEGYAISIFESGGQGDAPGQLLATYLAPTTAVDIAPAQSDNGEPLIGWDKHEVWEYAVDFDQTFLEHAIGPAEPEAFFEEAGTEYWLSVAAWDGHIIDPVTGDAEDTGDEPRDEPWWGWHTTPKVGDDPNFINDEIFSATVSMENDEWIYDPWSHPPQEHAMDLPNEFAFELLTSNPNMVGLDGSFGNNLMMFEADTDTVIAPEPSSIMIICLGLLLGFCRRIRIA